MTTGLGDLAQPCIFAVQPSLDRNRVLSLSSPEFIERREMAHFLGPAGLGKAHLASAIGLTLLEKGWKMSFRRTTDLVQKLPVARRELALEAATHYQARFDLPILDDITYFSKDQAATSVLFEVIHSTGDLPRNDLTPHLSAAPLTLLPHRLLHSLRY